MSLRYRQAERLLYSYPANVLRLHDTMTQLRELRTETDCHAQSYTDMHSSEGRRSDPVDGYNARINALELRIQALIRDTDPVSAVRCELQASQLEADKEAFCVMELYYFDSMTMEEVAFHLRRSMSTVIRRRKDVVCMVMSELCDKTRSDMLE